MAFSVAAGRENTAHFPHAGYDKPGQCQGRHKKTGTWTCRNSSLRQQCLVPRGVIRNPTAGCHPSASRSRSLCWRVLAFSLGLLWLTPVAYSTPSDTPAPRSHLHHQHRQQEHQTDSHSWRQAVRKWLSTRRTGEAVSSALDVEAASTATGHEVARRSAVAVNRPGVSDTETTEAQQLQELFDSAGLSLSAAYGPTCPGLCLRSFPPIQHAITLAKTAAAAGDWLSALVSLQAAQATGQPCYQALVYEPSFLAYPMGDCLQQLALAVQLLQSLLQQPQHPLSPQRQQQVQSRPQPVQQTHSQQQQAPRVDPRPPQARGALPPPHPLPRLAPPSPPPPPMPQLGADCAASPEAVGQRLVFCSEGYAAGTTGGMGGVHYVVTAGWDDPGFVVPGTLRYGVEAYYGRPVWITFGAPFDIQLGGPLYLGPDTTIDGRGAGGPVTLRGAMIAIVNVSNVIIHGIAVEDVVGNHDAIPIRNSRMVWVDHCRLTRAFRGLVDVVFGATQVTVSYNYLQNPPVVLTVAAAVAASAGIGSSSSSSLASEAGGRGGSGGQPTLLDAGYVMLLGESDEDTASKAILVTVVGNWFDNSHQRQPHIRWGKVHVVNNLFTDWTYYCLGGRVHGQLRSENNVFMAGEKGAKEVTPWFAGALSTPGFDSTANIHSIGDLLENGATLHQFLNGPIFEPPYQLTVLPTDGLAQFVMQRAGPTGV